MIRSFQSPHGDSFFSDTGEVRGETLQAESGFNPLTGIRSFLTVNVWLAWGVLLALFQSPHGDSFFSDNRKDVISQAIMDDGFNPLTGIRSFLTQS